MRSVILTSFGGLDALELADVPGPAVPEGDEVVSVRAVTLGRWDLSTADGYFAALGGPTAFPQVPGWDFASCAGAGRRGSMPASTRSGCRPLPGTSPSGSRPPFRWPSSAAAMTWWPAVASAARSSS